MTTSSRVALKAGGTQMNGEISGKKIQNMDIMEVRKNKYTYWISSKMVSTKTNIVQGGVLEFAPLPEHIYNPIYGNGVFGNIYLSAGQHHQEHNAGTPRPRPRPRPGPGPRPQP